MVDPYIKHKKTYYISLNFDFFFFLCYRVTIVKDRETHKSKGLAFVLFLEKESAHTCVRALNRKELFGRTLKCSIATDNGRATEFIRRKFYKDKSQCYECGVSLIL